MIKWFRHTVSQSNGNEDATSTGISYSHLGCDGEVQQFFTAGMAGRWDVGAVVQDTPHLGGIAELCEGPSHVADHRPIRRHLPSIAAQITLQYFARPAGVAHTSGPTSMRPE